MIPILQGFRNRLTNKKALELEKYHLAKEDEEKKLKSFICPYLNFKVRIHPGCFRIESINHVSIQEEFGLFVWKYGDRTYNEEILHLHHLENFKLEENQKSLIVEMNSSEEDFKNFITYLYLGVAGQYKNCSPYILFNCDRGQPNLQWNFNSAPIRSK